MTPDIGLPDADRNAIIETLNAFLADEIVLYMKLRSYHWNVTGPHFKSLHELFEEQYTELATTIDELAERIAAYGGKALGTLKESLERTRLREGSASDADAMCKDLLSDHEALMKAFREALGAIDEVAAEDFLTALLQTHQDMAWMLRASCA